MLNIKEAHPHGGDWLREIVFGMNDGLVTTLVFIMAVSAVASTRLVLIALSEVVAGGISMALGGYLSARTEFDLLEQRIATERHEIQHEPEEEREELRAIYRDKGLRDDLVERVVDQLTSEEDRWLHSMVHDELGVLQEGDNRAWMRGALVGGSFALGGIVPVLPIMVSLPYPQVWAFVFTAVVAIALGKVKARYSLKGALRNGLEFLGIITIGTVAGILVGAILHAIQP